ncbi:hypothetical protein [Streptomyces sp. NPDC057428]|uniref:hypothetical protein n=1 Tax=Streptomyces sp. NPDC057428 TaxID=3346129 RepID=UPI0036B7CF27
MRLIAKRWVRYVMVEIDVDDDKVTRVVALSEKVREDRGGMGHFLATSSSSGGQ